MCFSNLRIYYSPGAEKTELLKKLNFPQRIPSYLSFTEQLECATHVVCCADEYESHLNKLKTLKKGDIPIVSPLFVIKCSQVQTLLPYKSYSADPKMIFSGTVCLIDCTDDVQTILSSLVESRGGEVIETYNGHVTHYISSNSPNLIENLNINCKICGKVLQNADGKGTLEQRGEIMGSFADFYLHSNVFPMTPLWVDKCMEQHKLVNEADYTWWANRPDWHSDDIRCNCDASSLDRNYEIAPFPIVDEQNTDATTWLKDIPKEFEGLTVMISSIQYAHVSQCLMSTCFQGMGGQVKAVPDDLCHEMLNDNEKLCELFGDVTHVLVHKQAGILYHLATEYNNLQKQQHLNSNGNGNIKGKDSSSSLVAIVNHRWLDVCIAHKSRIPCGPEMEVFREFSVNPDIFFFFKPSPQLDLGHSITVSGYTHGTRPNRSELMQCISSTGSITLGPLSKKYSTMLVASPSQAKSTKCIHAENWGMPIVTADYIVQCLLQEKKLDPSNFTLDKGFTEWSLSAFIESTKSQQQQQKQQEATDEQHQIDEHIHHNENVDVSVDMEVGNNDIVVEKEEEEDMDIEQKDSKEENSIENNENENVEDESINQHDDLSDDDSIIESPTKTYSSDKDSKETITPPKINEELLPSPSSTSSPCSSPSPIPSSSSNTNSIENIDNDEQNETDEEKGEHQNMNIIAESKETEINKEAKEVKEETTITTTEPTETTITETSIEGVETNSTVKSDEDEEIENEIINEEPPRKKSRDNIVLIYITADMTNINVVTKLSLIDGVFPNVKVDRTTPFDIVEKFPDCTHVATANVNSLHAFKIWAVVTGRTIVSQEFLESLVEEGVWREPKESMVPPAYSVIAMNRIKKYENNLFKGWSIVLNIPPRPRSRIKQTNKIMSSFNLNLIEDIVKHCGGVAVHSIDELTEHSEEDSRIVIAVCCSDPKGPFVRECADNNIPMMKMDFIKDLLICESLDRTKKNKFGESYFYKKRGCINSLDFFEEDGKQQLLPENFE